MILGRLQEARQTVEIAIALSPHEAQVGWEHLCRGLCDYALGDLEAAETSFRQSARRPVTSALAEVALAATLVRPDRRSEAADIITRVMQEASPDAFSGVRQYSASWRGSLSADIRRDLIEAGLAPELWPIES